MTSRALLHGGVIVALAVTPSALEAGRAWAEEPDKRLPLVVWYAAVTVLALAAWRAL